MLYAGNAHTRKDPFESRALDTQTGAISRYQAMPAGGVIDHEMPAASIFLSHPGGAAKAQMQGGYEAWATAPNTPDFAIKDGVIYCAPEDATHDYVMSVGTISPAYNPN